MDEPVIELGRPHNGGHTFSHVNASGSSRLHLGDVYNYHSSDFAEKRTIDWLTRIDPSKDHYQASKQFKDGTLSWFFENDHFQHWCHSWEGANPWLLWCRGGMGTSKTTLAAQVLSHLLAVGISKSNIAVVYCRFPEQETQTKEQILGSILAQLYQREARGFDIPREVQQTFESQPQFRGLQATIDQLEAWLASRLRAQNPVFIVLDALDELQNDTRRDLISFFQRLPQSVFRLFTTSRHPPTATLTPYEVYEMEVSTHEEDLQTLVYARLHEPGSEDFQQLVSQADVMSRNAIEVTIQHKVVTAANNMFIHASFSLNRILECTRLDNIYYYLDHMPPDLDALYDQVWERATSDEFSVLCKRAKLILMWVSHAEEHLTVQCVREALAASDPNMKGALLTKGDLVSCCAGFIRIEPLPVQSRYRDANEDLAFDSVESQPESDLVVAMVHLPVYQYFRNRRHVYFPGANDKIVAACLRVLNSNELACVPPLHRTIMTEYNLTALDLSPKSS